MAEERLSSYNICQQSLQKLKAKRKSGEKKKRMEYPRTVAQQEKK